MLCELLVKLPVVNFTSTNFHLLRSKKYKASEKLMFLPSAQCSDEFFLTFHKYNFYTLYLLNSDSTCLAGCPASTMDDFQLQWSLIMPPSGGNAKKALTLKMGRRNDGVS